MQYKLCATVHRCLQHSTWYILLRLHLRHRSSAATTVRWLPVSCLCRNTAVRCSVVGPFLWPARRPGTRYQTTFEIRRVSLTVFVVTWKLFFSRSTSVHSALGASRLCAIQIYYMCCHWHWHLSETCHKHSSYEWHWWRGFQGQRSKVKVMTRPNAVMAEACISTMLRRGSFCSYRVLVHGKSTVHSTILSCELQYFCHWPVNWPVRFYVSFFLQKFFKWIFSDLRHNRLSLAEKLKLFSEKIEVRPSPATPSMRKKNRRHQSRFKTQVRAVEYSNLDHVTVYSVHTDVCVCV